MGRVTAFASAITLALLATPAVAAATTYTVDPGAAAGCAGTTCRTITDANAKVADGDVIQLEDGTFTQAPLAITKKITLKAIDPLKATITTPAPAAGLTAPPAVITIGDGSGAANGTTLSGLVVSPPAAGTSAVAVQATGTTVDSSILLRNGTTTDAPVYTVDDSGSGTTAGTNTLSKTLVFDLPKPASPGTTPAVQGGTRTSLVVADGYVVANDQSGPGVAFAGSDPASADTVLRGVVTALKPASAAITSAATTAGAKALHLDSVALTPGSGAAAVAVSSSGVANVGDTTVSALHVTTAGGGLPFAIDAAATGGSGSIAVTADRSILHGAGQSTIASVAPLPIVMTGGNTASLAIARSDTTDTAKTGETTTATSSTPDAQLFAGLSIKDLHLRPGAPLIDTGETALAAGQSTTDFEGDPRIAGAAADPGADEFVNKPPKASLVASRAQAAENQSVTFDASASKDQELDSPITLYAFSFGDGSPVVMGTAATVTHAFAKPGVYKVTVGVADGQGATATASTSVAVSGTPPTVTIATPKDKQVVRLFSVKHVKRAIKTKKGARKRYRRVTVRTLRKIVFTGSAKGESPIAYIGLSLRRVGASKTNCAYFDPKRHKVVASRCSKPLYFLVAQKNGAFSYKLPTTAAKAFRAGAYELSVVALDRTNAVSAPATRDFSLR